MTQQLKPVVTNLLVLSQNFYPNFPLKFFFLLVNKLHQKLKTLQALNIYLFQFRQTQQNRQVL
jgi:hypothetical protein